MYINYVQWTSQIETLFALCGCGLNLTVDFFYFCVLNSTELAAMENEKSIRILSLRCEVANFVLSLRMSFPLSVMWASEWIDVVFTAILFDRKWLLLWMAYSIYVFPTSFRRWSIIVFHFRRSAGNNCFYLLASQDNPFKIFSVGKNLMGKKMLAIDLRNSTQT